MQGIIFAYDVTRRETFEAIQQVWMQEVQNYSTVEKAVMMIVANKVDRDSEREVSRAEGAAFAKSKGCLFVETSAKANTAVTQVWPHPAPAFLHACSVVTCICVPRSGAAHCLPSELSSSMR